MYERKILLNSIDAVKNFSAIINKQEGDCDLIAENHKYVVDAKSIMGIFSLDLSNPVTLRSYTDLNKNIETQLSQYFV